MRVKTITQILLVESSKLYFLSGRVISLKQDLRKQYKTQEKVGFIYLLKTPNVGESPEELWLCRNLAEHFKIIWQSYLILPEQRLGYKVWSVPIPKNG